MSGQIIPHRIIRRPPITTSLHPSTLVLVDARYAAPAHPVSVCAGLAPVSASVTSPLWRAPLLFPRASVRPSLRLTGLQKRSTGRCKGNRSGAISQPLLFCSAARDDSSAAAIFSPATERAGNW